uniref:Secreted protein n=1 Tax=Steinernema glaseri TaxID=37863 RepID=A0A1I7ZKW4_9BILA
MYLVRILLFFLFFHVQERHFAWSKSVSKTNLIEGLGTRLLRRHVSVPEQQRLEELHSSSYNLMRFLRRRRSISTAVVETANCEHEHLVECEEYDSDEKKCWITYGGMRCCICTGRLKMLRTRKWLLW